MKPNSFIRICSNLWLLNQLKEQFISDPGNNLFNFQRNKKLSKKEIHKTFLKTYEQKLRAILTSYVNRKIKSSEVNRISIEVSRPNTPIDLPDLIDINNNVSNE